MGNNHIKELINNSYNVGDYITIISYTNSSSSCTIRDIREKGIIVQGEFGLGFVRYDDINKIEHRERNSYIKKLHIDNI